MNIWGWMLIAYFTTNAIGGFWLIDRQRKPITADQAVSMALIYVLLILAVVNT